MKFSLEYAKNLDQQDRLAKFRDQFLIPKDEHGKDKIYLSGNSLGLQPKQTAEYIQREIEDWGKLGVKGHLHARNPWVYYHKHVKAGLAEVVGAKENEVAAMNSLTTNLHLCMVSFFCPTPKRHKILMLKNAFPSDQYALKSQLRFHNLTENSLIQIGPAATEEILDPDLLYQTIEEQGDQIAVVLLEGVNYLTGQLFDMKKITELAHRKGCVVGFDLAHAIGNAELSLHDWNVDFAVWCNYKYLNAGPGAVGGCFIHEKYSNDSSIPRFEGWWGHSEERRFLMEPDFVPMEGVDAWQLSNVQIFSSASLWSSLTLFQEAGMKSLRKKSEELTGYAELLLHEHCKHQLHIITPKEKDRRGCQLSIAFKHEAKGMFDKLIQAHVVCDWREPNVIRIAPTPFYNSFEDVYKFVEILNNI